MRKHRTENWKIRSAERRLLVWDADLHVWVSVCRRKHRQKQAGSYGAGGLFGCLTPQPRMSPADKGHVQGSCVLCCDTGKLQGWLGSNIIGLANSEPITPISFSQRCIWRIDEKKSHAQLTELGFLGFVLFFWDRHFLCSVLPFVPKQTLVIFRSCLLYSERKNRTSWVITTTITVLSFLWFPFLIINLPVFSLFDVLISISVHCLCISLFHAHSFHSLGWSARFENVKEKISLIPHTHKLQAFQWQLFREHCTEHRAP